MVTRITLPVTLDSYVIQVLTDLNPQIPQQEIFVQLDLTALPLVDNTVLLVHLESSKALMILAPASIAKKVTTVNISKPLQFALQAIIAQKELLIM